jgi:hypothetical protein
MTVIERYHPAELNAVCAQVSTTLRQGGIVAIPTETYYGLGVDPFNSAALRRLAKVKGRSDEKPVLLLIGAPKQLSALVEQVPPVATVLMEAFWPGRHRRNRDGWGAVDFIDRALRHSSVSWSVNGYECQSIGGDARPNRSRGPADIG